MRVQIGSKQETDRVDWMVSDLPIVVLLSTAHTHYPRPNLSLSKRNEAICGLSAKTSRGPSHECLESVATFNCGSFPTSSSGSM